jgi:glycerol-3-phosphate dehydrogenase
VLDLTGSGQGLGAVISPESRDIYAQVAYSVREEGARTLSDIILRRMHIGMTGSHGLVQAQKMADIAGRELQWNEDEKRHQVEEFKNILHREVECLKR